MISAADDYPLHQSSRPTRDPGTDRNLYDRFFFNGYAVTGPEVGRTFFAVAFGEYLGRNVMDGAFSIVADGVQHNVRGSRALGEDRLDLHAGPVRITIVEPGRVHRVQVDAPEAGVTADLRFTARAAAFEEPHYRYAPAYRTVMDITRMTQGGTWSGTITVAGRTIAVDDATWQGGRDRSWGSRHVGERDHPGGEQLAPQYYWLWAPLNFPDQAMLFDCNELADGTTWHESAMVAPVGSDDPARWSTAVEHALPEYRIAWRSGTRHAESFSLDLTFKGGRTSHVELEPLLTFYMQGIGYGHPTWGHGMFVGPDERGHDSFATAEAPAGDPLFRHVQQLARATRDDGTVGYGILEILVHGVHTPSGFDRPDSNAP